MECNFLLTMTVYNQKKVMVNVWWSVAGLVHNRFRNPIETITAEKFCRQINEMRAKLQYMCRDWVNIKGSILLHIYPRPYSSMTYTTKAIWLELRNSRSSWILADLSPTDYHFFKYFDYFLRQKCLKTQSDAVKAFKDFNASRTEDFYVTGINKLVPCLQRCIDSNGYYFE